jgi:hypothetical protein
MNYETFLETKKINLVESGFTGGGGTQILKWQRLSKIKN